MRIFAKESRNKDNTPIVIEKINKFIEDYREDIRFLLITSAYNQTSEGLETVVDFRFQLKSEEEYIGNHITLYEYNMPHSEKFKKVQEILNSIDYKGRIIKQTILGNEKDPKNGITINGHPLYEGYSFEFNGEEIVVSHWDCALLFFTFEDEEDPLTYPSFVKSVPLLEVEGLEIRAD